MTPPILRLLSLAYFLAPFLAFAQGSGLSSRPDGTVFDANLNVTWLADANFAASPAGKAILAAQGVTGVNPSGLMDYPNAVRFVQALNSCRQKECSNRGYLCHSDWQLPAIPGRDPTCTVHRGADGNSFGSNCRQSTFGSLFYVGLGLSYPTSVAPGLENTVGPMRNLQPSLYWTSTSGAGAGMETFSFLNGLFGANTVRYNLLHVLAMHAGVLPGSAPERGAAKTGAVVAYASGQAAGRAVYDSVSGTSWLLNANLAATESFGVGGTTDIPATGNDNAITLPLLAPGGALHFSAVEKWVAGLSAVGYAGGRAWSLPALSDLQRLYADLGLAPGNPALLASDRFGSFQNFQPFFYWACHSSSGGRCDYEHFQRVRAGIKMRWSFNFDTGFQGTSQETKQYFVLVYHPRQ